jgi:hypothetical protein
VKWLVEQGCPYDAAQVCRVAAENDYLAVIQLVLQLEPLSPEHLTLVLSAAAWSAHLQVAAWLRQQGAQWPAVLKYGGCQWSPEAIAWARREGCTSTTLY